MSLLRAGTKKINVYSKFYQETGIKNSKLALDNLNYTETTYNRWLYKKVLDWNIIKEKPELFVNYFINKLPFIIFFYLPFFALFTWLLYVRSSFNYMEHLIFTFHVQTTFFVLFTLALIFDLVFTGNYGMGFTFFIFMFYLYKAMRKFYGQKPVKTLVKFMFLSGIFFILATIATVISVITSFAIY